MQGAYNNREYSLRIKEIPDSDTNNSRANLLQHRVHGSFEHLTENKLHNLLKAISFYFLK